MLAKSGLVLPAQPGGAWHTQNDGNPDSKLSETDLDLVKNRTKGAQDRR